MVQAWGQPHWWPDCPFLAELKAAYVGGMTLWTMLAMAKRQYGDGDWRDDDPFSWPDGPLDSPTYARIRQRLIWGENVLRPRGRQALIVDREIA
jgi:hypothetical protein